MPSERKVTDWTHRSIRHRSPRRTDSGYSRSDYYPDVNPIVMDLVPSDVLCERYPDRPVVSFRETRTAKVGKKTKYVDVVTVRGGRYMVLGKPVFIPEDVALDMPWRHGDANSPMGTDVFVLLDADADIRVLEFKPQYIDDPVAAIDAGVVASWNDNGALVSLQTYNPEQAQTGDYFRVLGGMHTLCANAGPITGSTHPMWQRPAGSVIPMSVWAVNFRPACPDPRAMAYVRETDTWVDIYNASGDIASPETRFGGVRLRLMAQTEFEVGFGNVGKRLLSADDFLFAARGSPAGVTVNQNTDYGVWFGMRSVFDGSYYTRYADNGADTTGGHSSTDSKRLLSDIGCEEMCGLQNQWLRVRPDGVSESLTDNYNYERDTVWTPVGLDMLGRSTDTFFYEYSKYHMYHQVAERAGGGASDPPAACGPASVNASYALRPMGDYWQWDYVDEEYVPQRDIALHYGSPLYTSDADDVRAYYTGSRGCSPCMHISVRHQELSSDVLPNFLWFRNVWWDSIVLNFEDISDVYVTDRAVLEFAKLSGTMAWIPYDGSTEEQRTFGPDEVICVRAPAGVTNRQFGMRFRPLSTYDWPSYEDRWRALKGDVEVGGNIMAVLKQGVTEFPDETYDFAFYNMFSQCPSLYTAENLVLPARTAVSGCYFMMFGDYDRSVTDSYLTSPPEIEAERVRPSFDSGSDVRSPFEMMFASCVRMYAPPYRLSLEPAMYSGMFFNCTSLQLPPEITSTNFQTDLACNAMFSGCTSLRYIPWLDPVGPVGESAMQDMFYNTALRFSTTRHDEYQFEWSLPLLTSGTDGPMAFDGMLNGTTPTRGVTYYFDNIPIFPY